MSTIERHTLETAAEYAGIEDVRTDYSGRGMYGAECIGIVYDLPSEVGAFLDELSSLAAEYDDETLAATVRNMRGTEVLDNMALSMIAYWPDVQVEE